MKKLKTILSCIIFLILMLGINEFFHYLLIDDTKSYTRIMMHELYESEENIDVLFLGSSHSYRSLNPEITDEVFGAHTFNAGTSLQGLDTAYALLVETDKQNDLKEVYVELYYGITSETYHERKDLTATYLVSDYMKPSFNRIQLLINASSPKHYFNSFILGRREWEKLFDAAYLNELFAKKQSTSYKNYEYIVDATDAYMGRGFVGSSIIYGEDSNYMPSESFAFYDNYISKDCKTYLGKIIDYCKKNNIRLAFYSAPMHNFDLASFGNYDYYIKQVNDFLADYDVFYYDFNLCKPEILDIDGTKLMDSHHLNIAGAEQFSRVFGEFFTGKLDESIFYPTFNAKLKDIDTPLLGYIMKPMDEFFDEVKDEDKYFDFDTYNYVSINPLTYKDVTFEYRISKDVDDNILPFQDWHENTILFYPKNESGIFYIEARITGTTEIINETHYEYH